MIETQAVVSGIFTGGGYALVAVAITLMFRSTGVLSFAHAAFAAVSAYLYVDFVDRGWAHPLAAAVAVLGATAYGLVVERVAIRPVRYADAATRLIATLGVLTLTTGLLLWHYGFSPVSAELLLPDGSVTILDVAVSYQKMAVLVVAAVAAVLLGWFLERTRFGTAVRAVAQDAEAARLHGVSLANVARFNWALGAALSAVVGVLIAPLASVNVGTFTLLLAKALTGTLVGGMASLPLSFAGGLLVGVVESFAVIRFEQPGAPEVGVLLLVVAVLVLRRKWPAVPEAPTDARPARRIPPLVRTAGEGIQRLLLPLMAVGAVMAVTVPARSTYWAFVGGRSLFFVIEALSLVILVGWGGQVSLMQGAYVGIGAFGTAYLVGEHDMSLLPALLLSALAGAALGALAGLPALRLSGLQFAVASLAFSAAAAGWLFERPEFPTSMSRGDLLGIDLQSDIAVYFVMLAITAVLFLVAWNIRRSAQGSLLIAARDASSTAAHFGVNSSRVRMGAFLVASFISALGGGLYVVLTTGVSAGDFTSLLSLSLLVYTVVGGTQSLLGPVLAGVAFGVLPQVLQSDAGTSANAVPDIIAGVIVVVLLATRPQGLASAFPLDRIKRAASSEAGASEDPAEVYSRTRARLARRRPPTVGRLAALSRRRAPLNVPTTSRR